MTFPRKTASIFCLAFLVACGDPQPASLVEDTSPSPSPEATSSVEGTSSTATSSSSKGGSDGPNDAVVLSGTVTDSNGKPVPDFCIDIWAEGDEEWSLHRAAARTNDEGRYTWSQDPDPYLAHEEYQIRFRDCRTEPRFAFQWFDGVVDVSQAAMLNIEKPAVADAVLRPPGSLSGRLIDSYGDPASGVCVRLYDGTLTDDVDEGKTYTPYAATTTDSDGRYRFKGLAAKDYRLQFEAGNRWIADCSGGLYGSEWYDDKNPEGTIEETWPDVTTVTVGVGENVDEVDAELEAMGIITGKVNAAGSGCDYAAIAAFPADQPDPGMEKADYADHYAHDCSWSFKLVVPPGSYKLRIQWRTGGPNGSWTTEWWEEEPSWAAARVVTIDRSRRTARADVSIRPATSPSPSP